MEECHKNASPKISNENANTNENSNSVDTSKNKDSNQNSAENKSSPINKAISIKENNTKENTYKCINLKNSVKSQYIIQKIFLYLNDKQKLFMIRYNKYYNNLLEIDIEFYKKISGKIKIGGVNGYGKVYDLERMDLIYKGYYNNGNRNGEGKEYDCQRLIFEGEYVNGKRHGKGIEYSYSGKLLFVGEYINGKKWNGKFQEYDRNLLKFDGEY